MMITLFCLISLLGVNLGVAQQIHLDSGLIAYYPFNGNATDESFNNNDGSVIGASLASDRWGQLNKAFHFNGLSDYVNIADKDTLDMSTNNFSISFWLNTTQHSASSSIFQTSGVVLYKGAWWNEMGYCLYVRGVEYGSIGGHICAELAGGQFGYGTVIEQPDSQIIPINDGYWHNIVFLVDRNDQAKIYVDGNLYISKSIVLETGSFSNTLPLTLGGMESNDRRFNGFLDEVRIYTRLLTLDEIQALNLSTGLNKNNADRIQVFPNPVQDNINIQGIDNISNILIYSIDGALVKQGFLNKELFSVSDIANGTYLLKIIDKVGMKYSRVFVKY